MPILRCPSSTTKGIQIIMRIRPAPKRRLGPASIPPFSHAISLPEKVWVPERPLQRIQINITRSRRTGRYDMDEFNQKAPKVLVDYIQKKFRWINASDENTDHFLHQNMTDIGTLTTGIVKAAQCFGFKASYNIGQDAFYNFCSEIFIVIPACDGHWQKRETKPSLKAK